MARSSRLTIAALGRDRAIWVANLSSIEANPLLDFNRKEHRTGGTAMHPLRKLRESGKPTAAQVSELLAENIVFNSLILVRPIPGA